MSTVGVLLLLESGVPGVFDCRIPRVIERHSLH